MIYNCQCKKYCLNSRHRIKRPQTLPVYRRQGESYSRWSEAPLRSAWGATLRSRRQTQSNGAATRRAAPALRNRRERGRGSSKRNQVVSGVSRAGPHLPFPFSFPDYGCTTGYFKLPFMTRCRLSLLLLS